MKALLTWVYATRRSVLAFGISFALGLLSMGFQGIALYYLVAPVLRLRFASWDQWHGDWAWPAMIGVGMAWSAGFLLAGVVNYFLAHCGLQVFPRRLVYVGILWTWALLLWSLTLESLPNPASP